MFLLERRGAALQHRTSSIYINEVIVTGDWSVLNKIEQQNTFLAIKQYHFMKKKIQVVFKLMAHNYPG